MYYSNGNDADIITTQSTSSTTAKANPIVLNETDLVKTSFEPVVVENNKDKNASVFGKLIHQKKRKSDEVFPLQRISKKDLRVGDILEINLNATETKLLYDGLTNLYQLYKDTGGIVLGQAKFTKIKASLIPIIRELESIGDDIDIQEIIQCINVLFYIIVKRGETSRLIKELGILQNTENLTKTVNYVNLARIESALSYFKIHYGSEEEEWQQFFKRNQWIISQLFSYPVTIFAQKAYMGGKALDNTGGKVVDFLYSHDLTNNLAIVEIKTPQTRLLSKLYRDDIYNISDELSGGVNQVLRYRDSLVKNSYAFCGNGCMEVLNPDTILIIGSLSELDDENKITSFQLWRSSLQGVCIVTFDEVEKRIANLVELLKYE